MLISEDRFFFSFDLGGIGRVFGGYQSLVGDMGVAYYLNTEHTKLFTERTQMTLPSKNLYDPWSLKGTMERGQKEIRLVYLVVSSSAQHKTSVVFP